MNIIKAVFIDRDGTMGNNSNVEFPTQFLPFTDISDTIRRIKAAGFLCIAVTNQSCIARGKDGGYDFAAEFRGYGLDDWFICPHDTDDHCNCRKPQSGLLEAASAKYGIDMRESYMIGDRWSDLMAGISCGCKTILVLTGRGCEELASNPKQIVPTFVAENLGKAADCICSEQERADVSFRN